MSDMSLARDRDSDGPKPVYSSDERRFSQIEGSIATLVNEVAHLTASQSEFSKNLNKLAEQQARDNAELRQALVKSVGDIQAQLEQRSHLFTQDLYTRTKPDWTVIVSFIAVAISIVAFFITRYDGSMSEIKDMQKTASAYNNQEQYNRGHNASQIVELNNRLTRAENALDETIRITGDWRTKSADRLGKIEAGTEFVDRLALRVEQRLFEARTQQPNVLSVPPPGSR